MFSFKWAHKYFLLNGIGFRPTCAWTVNVKLLFSHNNCYFSSSTMNNNAKLARPTSSSRSVSTIANGSLSVTEIPTAGIIVIGDEILKGQTLDVNTQFLTHNLYKLGVKVMKVSVIADDVSTIAEEVSLFSKKYTHVITSGGIGPTHDDVTFEGIATAFGENLHSHPVIVQFMQQWLKTTDLKAAAMKMANIPESSVLHFGEEKERGVKAKFPCVLVRNVAVFPGVPHLLRKSFNMVGKELFGHSGSGFFTSELYFTLDELSFEDHLNESVSKFPQVTFGSYPELFHSYYKTKVTLESSDDVLLKEAEKFLRSRMEGDSIVDYVSDTITDPWKNLDSNLSPAIISLFTEAMTTIENCFQRYSCEEICVCYNGGKDCLVALHMTHAFMRRHFPDKRIVAVYITEEKAFPQVTDFVNRSINRYNLDCEILPGPLKKALSDLLVRRPSIKAVIMGTRRVDPHGDTLKLFSPTDGDWPPVMRVSPILEWKYDQVWSFIRQLFLPYCALYDRGYTSLGSLDNTLPNPTLQSKDTLGRVRFLPAHQLQQVDLERKGRIVFQK